MNLYKMNYYYFSDIVNKLAILPTKNGSDHMSINDISVDCGHCYIYSNVLISIKTSTYVYITLVKTNTLRSNFSEIKYVFD
jgi:hypothetical protein